MRAALLATFVAWLAAFPAHAQPEAGAPAEDRDRARALFDEAAGARERGDWAEACALLERSLDAFPYFPTAWNLATARERDDDLAGAERILVRIRDGEFGALDREQRRSVADRLDAIAPRLATLNLVFPESVQRVDVDGDLFLPVVTPGRLRLRLAPGNHDVAITLPEGDRVQRSVELEARATLRLSLRPPPPSGRLIVEAEDASSDLMIEGVARGAGRLVLSLPPDEYRVRNVTQDDLRVVRLEAGGTERVFFAIPSEVWESPWLWIGLGVLVAAGVAIPSVYVATESQGPMPATFEAPPL